MLPVYQGRQEMSLMLYHPGEEGQGLMEYALILSLVVLIVIVVLVLLGPAIGNMYSNIISYI